MPNVKKLNNFIQNLNYLDKNDNISSKIDFDQINKNDFLKKEKNIIKNKKEKNNFYLTFKKQQLLYIFIIFLLLLTLFLSFECLKIIEKNYILYNKNINLQKKMDIIINSKDKKINELNSLLNNKK